MLLGEPIYYAIEKKLKSYTVLLQYNNTTFGFNLVPHVVDFNSKVTLKFKRFNEHSLKDLMNKLTFSACLASSSQCSVVSRRKPHSYSCNIFPAT